ncbi:hypothetical protein GBAR_LOCUS18998, partial [Geodia barretti]
MSPFPHFTIKSSSETNIFLMFLAVRLGVICALVKIRLKFQFKFKAHRCFIRTDSFAPLALKCIDCPKFRMQLRVARYKTNGTRVNVNSLVIAFEQAIGCCEIEICHRLARFTRYRHFVCIYRLFIVSQHKMCQTEVEVCFSRFAVMLNYLLKFFNRFRVVS